MPAILMMREMSICSAFLSFDDAVDDRLTKAGSTPWRRSRDKPPRQCGSVREVLPAFFPEVCRAWQCNNRIGGAIPRGNRFRSRVQTRKAVSDFPDRGKIGKNGKRQRDSGAARHSNRLQTTPDRLPPKFRASASDSSRFATEYTRSDPTIPPTPRFSAVQNERAVPWQIPLFRGSGSHREFSKSAFASSHDRIS